MFITPIRMKYVGSEQHTTSGMFFCLVSTDALPLDKDNFRGVVVRTHLEQCGHWMMGNASICGQRFTLSGSYGEDGLTMTVPKAIFDKCVPIPAELYEAWAHGGGWNGCGSEGEAMRKWAVENIVALKKVARMKTC